MENKDLPVLSRGFYFELKRNGLLFLFNKDSNESKEMSNFLNYFVNCGNDFIFEKEYCDSDLQNYLLGIKLNPALQIKTSAVLDYQRLKCEFHLKNYLCAETFFHNDFKKFNSKNFFGIYLQYEINLEIFFSETARVFKFQTDCGDCEYFYLHMIPKNQKIFVNIFAASKNLYFLKTIEKSTQQNFELKIIFFFRKMNFFKL